MKLKGRNFSHFLQKNKLIILLFLSSTSFFLYQHKNYWSWDFSAYLLNAKYWFNDGNYFEWYRPPLTPLLLGILGILNWKLSEYLYIIFVSTLFAFSCLKFEKVFIDKDPTLFYALMLSPFLLSNGLFAGTELYVAISGIFGIFLARSIVFGISYNPPIDFLICIFCSFF